MNKINNKNNYISFFNEIKQRIRHAQYEAMKAVNTEIIALYWEIGRSIAEKQANGWGKSIVEQLSKDIQKEFPGIKGFGTSNLWNMANSPAEFIRDNLNLGVANVPNNSNTQSNYTQHIDNVIFDMKNVKNYEELLSAMQKDKNFEQLILSMSINRIAGKSSLAKGKAIR